MKKAPQRRPLTGLRVLVGRARHQASALSAGLRALGAEVIEIPFIEIRPPQSYKPLDTALKQIAAYDWLILTSVNGVDALAARMKRLRMKPELFKQVKVAAIGPATRDAIKELGLKVAVVPERYVAESVVECLRGKVGGKKALLARAKIARDVIPRELRKLGANVDVVEAYKTVVPEPSREMLCALMRQPKKQPDIVTFTSSSTVRNFVELLREQEPPLDPGRIRCASIGPITSATLREVGLPVDIEAKEYTIPGLLRALVEGLSTSPSREKAGSSGRRKVRKRTFLPRSE
jgi:uroporphyrinogen-III synthase